jgi:TPP-dependent 2-oxoacid decarboxylase
MKLTAIMGSHGELVGVVHIHLSEHKRSTERSQAPHATLRPGPGQVFHEIEVSEDYRSLPLDELHQRVRQHVPD